MLFTIIAYRADGIDTCRGCEMGRSSSDCQIEYADEVEVAAKIIANYAVLDLFRDREYCRYEVTLLINGSDGQQYEHEFNDSEDQIYGIIQIRAAEIAQELIVEKNKEKAEKERTRVAAEKERQRLRDLEEFERLKARLGLTDKQD